MNKQTEKKLNMRKPLTQKKGGKNWTTVEIQGYGIQMMDCKVWYYSHVYNGRMKAGPK